MTVYRQPRPPESGIVWARSIGGNAWVKYVRMDDLWYLDGRAWGGITWGDLLEKRDYVTDVEPITESVDDLAQKIVGAAVAWYIAGWSDTAATNLRTAVATYNRRRNQDNILEENA